MPLPIDLQRPGIRFDNIRPIYAEIVAVPIIPGRKAPDMKWNKRSLAEVWGGESYHGNYRSGPMKPDDVLNPTQAAFLHRLVTNPGITIKGAEWNIFRALESRRLALKVGMKVYPSELGIALDRVTHQEPQK